MSRLARLLLLAILAWAAALPAAADPPMWRVRGPRGAEVVLFGSIHVLTEGLDWRKPALDAALARADTVWFETPFDEASRAGGTAAAQSRSRAPRGRTLSSYLAPRDRALLARTAQRLGLPMSSLEPYQPWYAEILISLVDLQRRGGRTDLGVEEQISARVPPMARRQAFETAAEQIAMFAELPPALQARALVDTLEEMEEKPDAFARLQQAWMDSDLAFIEREALTPMRTDEPALYRRLVVSRNQAWIGRIEALLRGSEKALIVVGVGHLIGPDSVPAMLRKRGYAVEGP